MAGTTGMKQRSYLERSKLWTQTPNDRRLYSCKLMDDHAPLIESFTKDDYRLYEQYLHKWGTPGRKRQVMLETIIKNGITGPVRQLAELRVEDLYQHQKLKQVLRLRWTRIAQVQKAAINLDSDKFWFKMACRIQSRCQSNGYELDPTWSDKAVLIEFLKQQYHKQEGRCAVSGEPLELTIGSKAPNGKKCSPDRRNSNRGYEPGNVWFVCWWVNQMKMNMPMITFWKRVNILAKRRSRQHFGVE